MKVYIGGYPSHWTTQRLDKIWYRLRYKKEDWEVERKDRDALDRAYERFASFWRTLVCRPHNWLMYKIFPISYIKIDNHDTWNMDSRLSPIILPMLKQLRETKHGAPYTEDSDVPEFLRSTAAKPKEHEWDTDEFHFARWDWIMDEMIWAFEQLNKEDQGEDQFRVGKYDHMFQPIGDNGEPIGEPYRIGEKPTDAEWLDSVKWYELVKGPNYTMIEDREGLENHWKRIKNGLRLFGAYYMNLWD